MKNIKSLFDDKSGRAIYKKFTYFTEKTGISAFLKGEILLGFSGGSDSVFLFLLLREYQAAHSDFCFTACHVNHSIRGEEAKRDEEFCRSFCENTGVAFFAKAVDVPAFSAANKLSMEEAARILRFDAFDEYLETHANVRAIATAQHATDLWETMIFRFLRGTGSRGLVGIRPVAGNRIHPLLPFSKTEIVDFLREKQIPFVNDSTNESDDCSRNYIRNQLSPRARKIATNLEDVSLRLSASLLRDNDYFEQVTGEYLSEYPTGMIPKKEFFRLHPAILARVVQKLCENQASVSPEYTHIEKIITLREFKKTFRVSLPGQIFAVFDGAYFYVQNKKPTTVLEKAELSQGENGEYSFFCGSFGFQLFTDAVSAQNTPFVYKYSIRTKLSSVIMNGKLFIRPRMDGDTVYYGGMTHKVKILLSDKKVPSFYRDQIPILCDENGVIWVPGFSPRQDDNQKNSKIAVAFYYNIPYFHENA